MDHPSRDDPTAKWKLTLDVIIPCYRVSIPVLSTILSLKASPSLAVTFIVIIDNPSSPDLPRLQSNYASRPDVHILVNQTNLGASASRNIGLDSSSAEWIHFLDDDVVPNPDLLLRAEEAIRSHPSAAGFVGLTLLPRANDIFTTAMHMTGMIAFWDIASKFPDSTDLPWGITANLIVRRNVKDGGVRFNLGYPKTGGGEDVHFCLEQAQYSRRNGGMGFVAAPKVVVTHPWWDGGRRSYRRFYGWAIGGAGLLKNFPEHVYLDALPNTAEMLFGCLLLAGLGFFTTRMGVLSTSFKASCAIIVGRIIHDAYQHLYLRPQGDMFIPTTLRFGSWSWLGAVVESSIIQIVGEAGFVWGLLARGEYLLLCRRFDWFAGHAGDSFVTEGRKSSVQRMLLNGLVFYFFRSAFQNVILL